MNLVVRSGILIALASLAALSTLPCQSLGLEVVRDTSVTPYYPYRSELILDDDPRRVAGPASCATLIRPDFETWLEANKLMVRLAEPFQMSGQLFEWRIGNRDGTTYWHRRQLDDGRSEISIYIPTEGVQFKIVAAFMTVFWSKGDLPSIDAREFREYGEKLLFTTDLVLNFADKINSEQLSIFYISRLATNIGSGDWRAVLVHLNRNIWISHIIKSVVRC